MPKYTRARESKTRNSSNPITSSQTRKLLSSFTRSLDAHVWPHFGQVTLASFGGTKSPNPDTEIGLLHFGQARLFELRIGDDALIYRSKDNVKLSGERSSSAPTLCYTAFYMTIAKTLISQAFDRQTFEIGMKLFRLLVEDQLMTDL